MRVFTKWITIDCPIDIANELSNLLMERWKHLKTDKKFEKNNLKDTIYAPRNRGLVDFNTRIDNNAKHNEFLRVYKDVTVLANVQDMDATFRYTKEMGKLFGDETQKGQRLHLRSFLRSWKDHSTGKPAIIAIHRTNNDKEYSLLSGNINMESIHTKIRLFFDELKGQMGFQKIRVGGTKGTNNKNNYPNHATDYAKDNFTTSRKFQQ